MLEIIKHHGPVRLGILRYERKKIPTPNFFSILTSKIELEHEIYLASQYIKTQKEHVVDYFTFEIQRFGILPDMHVGFNVPEEIAEISVEKTIEYATGYPTMGAVVQGSRFPHLREKCAKAFWDRPLLAIANGRKLLENPRLLVEILTKIREIASPNTAIYFPYAPPSAFYLLAYMGVDLFDSAICVIGARKNTILTLRGALSLKKIKEIPCSCKACEGKSPKDLIGDFDSILLHNFNVNLNAVREIRESIRSGEFRELVEEKAACDVNFALMLRLLDKEKQDFLERYTPI